jgi:hypothetical protein
VRCDSMCLIASLMNIYKIKRNGKRMEKPARAMKTKAVTTRWLLQSTSAPRLTPKLISVSSLIQWLPLFQICLCLYLAVTIASTFMVALQNFTERPTTTKLCSKTSIRFFYCKSQTEFTWSTYYNSINL